MYGNHMNPVVEYVSARVRPKKENQKNEKTCVNKHPKTGLEKRMDKGWKNLQKVIKKGGHHEEQTLKTSMRKQKCFWGVPPVHPEEPGVQ